jgi:hypothetical protein
LLILRAGKRLTHQFEGNPDPLHVSTSYVERSNLTVRMHMRRFTHLTNAFSKKVENQAYAMALYMMYYSAVAFQASHVACNGRWRLKAALGDKRHCRIGGGRRGKNDRKRGP